MPAAIDALVNAGCINMGVGVAHTEVLTLAPVSCDWNRRYGYMYGSLESARISFLGA